PVGKRPPEAEELPHVGADLPRFEVSPPLLAARIVHEETVVVILGDGQGIEEGELLASLFLPFTATAERHAGAAGENLQGLGEADVVHLLHEGEDVPALVAPEAMEELLLHVHVEGGSPLVVEWA